MIQKSKMFKDSAKIILTNVELSNFYTLLEISTYEYDFKNDHIRVISEYLGGLENGK